MKLFSFAVSFGAIVVCLLTPTHAKDRFHHVAVQYAALTSSAGKDTVRIEIDAKDISQPVSWTLTVISRGEIIYKYKQNDAVIDEFFKDPSFVDGCTSYVSCKKKYYLRDISTHLTYRVEPRLKDADFTENVQSTVTAYAKEQGLPAKPLIEAVLVQLTQKHPVALSIRETPVHDLPPMIWVPAFKRFVPFYQP